MQSPLQDEIETLRRRYRSEDDPGGLAFASLADAYRRAGELERAWAVLEEGLEEHPKSATGHLVAARLLRDRDRRSEAVERYERVLELDPENSEALLEASALAQHDGRIGDALALCQRLALVDPSDADLRARIRTLKEVYFTPEDDEEPSAGDDGPVPTGGGAADMDEDFADAWSDDPWTGGARAPSPDVEAGDEEAEAPGLDEETWMEEEPGGEAEEGPEPTEEEEPEGGPEAEPEVEVEESGVYTRTMADLYARQGHVERALRIYGHLLDRRPDDEDLRARIRNLEEESTAGEAGAPVAAYFESLLSWEGEEASESRERSGSREESESPEESESDREEAEE